MNLIENFDVFFGNYIHPRGVVRSIIVYSYDNKARYVETHFDILKINWLQKYNDPQPVKEGDLLASVYEGSLVIKFRDGEVLDEAVIEFRENDDFILHLKKNYPEIFYI
jgi:hypothetical protein